jgi:Rieske Fe-S protein
MRIIDPELITVPPDGRPLESQPKWRQAFPIDWLKDEYRSRRDFTKLLGLTSLAFVAGQLWIVLQGFRHREGARYPVAEIATVDSLPVGGSKLFHYPATIDPCILVRVSEEQFVAYSQKCTHLSCPVIPRPAEGKFHCPCHNGSFDLQTGYPLAGPPRRPLPRIDIQVRDGKIWAVGRVEKGMV